MAHYIDKDRIVAGVEKLISNGQTKLKESEECNDYESYVAWAERIATCINVLSLLDTLEVEESISVDLEKELDEWMKYGPHTSYPWCTIPDAIKITAEHFFALGLKAQKGEEV